MYQIFEVMIGNTKNKEEPELQGRNDSVTRNIKEKNQGMICVGKTLAGYKHGRPFLVLPRIRSQLPCGITTHGVPRGGMPRQ